MSEKTNKQYSYTQNRELSWLRFNQRVLEEAADTSIPALERLKFISIFASNLDEFFMVRVGSLFDIAHISPEEKDNKTGWSALEQLQQIYHTIPGLIALKKQIYKAVMEELKKSGIEDVSIDCLNENEHKEIHSFYKAEMLPILSPILIGAHHPVPHLVNKRLYVSALLENKKEKQAIGIVPVPDSISPYILLSDGKRFVRTENILLHYLPTLFHSYTVKESCVLCVTRNADISFDEEKFEDSEEDFRHQVKKLLKQRDHLSVIRLEIDKKISESFRNILIKLVKVENHQIYVDDCPLNMGYVFQLIGQLEKEIVQPLLYKPYKGRWPEDIVQNQRMTEQIRKKDKLLFYPYDSVEPFLKLLNEAAENPNVISIKITIYRLASSSKIAKTLCRAAEKGKEVLVLMEVRARFDEAHNLEWAKMLEESGCQVIYGMEGFKCHSKICLITMRHRGKMSYITQIGTGNYNEKTNAMYTDLSLMTGNSSIGEEATLFFRNMLTNNLEGNYKTLHVSPFGIKNMIIEKIDEQIQLGSDGYICIKANSITEKDMIKKLCEASQAGVEIQLIIRGICCILPGIPEYTENIHITSIVGRYLEHARIYLFGKGKDESLYISSADLMTRNLNRRVEIACPIYDETIREELKWILDAQLKDTAKASLMLSNGTYSRKQSIEPFDSQAYFMKESFHLPVLHEQTKESFTKQISQLWNMIFHNSNMG
ncbi:polyphosphate kinase 1 [Floccifex sp.]|uniref:polyphosphate kinase 1 n=1 Tax=Floccifex sp. TaxID=2815810 RepID=UPI003F070F0F